MNVFIERIEAGKIISVRATERAADADYRTLFQQLIASGFPVDGRARTTKAYRDRLDRFRSAIDGMSVEGLGAFSAVEAELVRMRGEGIVLNPLFGNVRLLFYHMISYYHCPTMFTFGAIGKIFGEITDDLRARGFPALDAFLKLMVGDLKRDALRRPRGRGGLRNG